MIYLIGGPPKCGKTTLAKLLSKTTGISWVSTDTIQDAVKPYVPTEDFATKFPASSMRFQTNDEKYEKHTAEEIIAGYRDQALTVQDAIMGYISAEVADENDHIIEGYHLEPKFIASISKKFSGQVKSCLIIKKDPELFVNDIKKSSTPNDWILSKTRDPATLPKIATMITEYGAQLEKEATFRSLKVFCTDKSFNDQMQLAVAYLTGNDKV
jgi:2-phosphoglycerate kinase